MKTNKGNSPNGQSGHRRNKRFQQLISLARERNQEAIGDLWREYGFDFPKEDSGNE